MTTETVETIIIGGGLSGIYAAHLLSRRNESYVVLEARHRIGGRVLSHEHRGFFSDLGPSWYWPEINPRMAALMGEIHDGSGNGHGPYGLTGFVGIPAVRRHHQHRLEEAILSQLAHIYGKPAAQPVALFYQDWAREPYTATAYDQPPMYEHPLYHPPAGKTTLWDGRIHFSGTETAGEQGGYMEGALIAAERAVMPHPGWVA